MLAGSDRRLTEIVDRTVWLDRLLCAKSPYPTQLAALTQVRKVRQRATAMMMEAVEPAALDDAIAEMLEQVDASDPVIRRAIPRPLPRSA
jgi:hypothetical protein